MIIIGDKLREIKRRMSETSQRSSDMFVLFMDTFEQVQPLLGNVKSLPFWNPKGRFMVVIAHPLLNDRQAIIQNIFHRTLSEKILEVVVVFRFFSSEHCNEDTNSCSLLTSDIQVASYNPFRHSKGINYITGVWPKVKDFKALFPSLSDVIGYPMRVAMFADPLSAVPVLGSNQKIQRFGDYDGHTVHSLAKYMNAEMVFVPQNDHTLFGTRNENGTLTGTCGDVAHGRADIISISQLTKDDLTELEYIYPHDANSLCFLVPKSKRVPQFTNCSCLSLAVWLVLPVCCL
jgi:hypothetical protein